MDKNIEALEAEIARVNQALTTKDPGTPEYSKVLTNFIDLYEQKIETDKIASAHEDRKTEMNYNYAVKTAELQAQEKKVRMEHDTNKAERIARLVFDGVSLGGTLLFYNVWMNRGFKFEETGVLSSKTFNGFAKLVKPFMK